MSRLTRYAAAVFHLGLRQAGRHLIHRATSHTRRFRRYASRPGGGLEFAGRAAAPFLVHAAGAALREGSFTALNRTRPVGDPPRWDTEGPLPWLFNLHYFGYIDPLPQDRQLRLVLDWIHSYPPSRRRPGWMPYPLSLRLRNWAKLLYLAPDWPAPDRAAVLASMEAQANCLADNLEFHLRGNHLLESGLTLKLLAAGFRGRATGSWSRLADAVLRGELDEQFLADGGHVERSPMYHALLSRGLLDLVNVLPERDPMRERILGRLPSILGFLAAVRHPDGDIALLNDAALGIAPQPEALLEYAAALGLRAPETAIAAFPQTGYYVWRRGGEALLVDAGPIGPDYLPAHGHGDIFSFEMSLGGKRVVIDGGTSTYEAGAERDWARSTRAHNTVELAGADQCEFFGAFRVGRRGRPREVTAHVSEEGLRVHGWHDGYRRLPGRPLHHRELAFRPPGILLVWDTVKSRVDHPAVSRIRFPPGAVLHTSGPREALVDLGGQELVVRAFGGEVTEENGQYAPRFGERLLCPVIALRKGREPEFGYAIAPRHVATAIDAAGALLDGHRLERKARQGDRGVAEA